jgi:ABC-type lipoprotein release transport system permease subunit
MAAIRIRFRAELRARWRAWLILALAGGLAGGLLVAMAAASHRTATAFDRFLVAVNAADAYVGRGIAVGQESLEFDRIARLPQVAESERRLLLAIIGRSRSGRPIYPQGPGALEVQVPSDGHRVAAIDRQKLVDGRRPDPARPHEVLADTKSIRQLGIRLGEAITMRFISHDALWSGEDFALSSDPRAVRVGSLARLRIVGVAADWHSDVDAGYLYLTPAFYRAYGGRKLGSWLEELLVRLKRGAADLPAFRAQVQRIAGERNFYFFDPSDTLPKVERSIDLQAQALRLLTALGATAALLLVGQALFRQALIESASHPTLRALGMTRAHLMALGTARAVVIAAPATALSVLLAFALSPLAPIGRARELEPAPGFHFDAAAIASGAAVVLAGILLLGVLATVRAAHAATAGGDSARPGHGKRRGSPTSALVRAGWPPPVVMGVRMALASRARVSSVPVRATLVAAILAVGVTATALTFAASLQHLLDTPRLYGQTWDFDTGFGGPSIEAATLRRVRGDPAISDVGVGALGPVEIGGRPVGARAIDDLKGSSAPTVLDGRAPRASGEILLGAKTLDTLHRSVGDTVAVHSGSRAVRLRIVGRGVLPSTKWNKVGEGAAFTFEDYKRIQPEAAASTLQARIASGADRDAALRRLALIFDAPSAAARPTDVGDFGGVEALPLLIAAVFSGAAAAALGHALVISIRRRRRDLAVLKTLGFTRGQVTAVVASQATTVVAIGLLVGLPLGVAVGRFAWNVFAEDLGVVPEAVTPIRLTALVVPAAILLANLIAALPARSAAHTRPALVLRAE